jgi:hypothetical protein
MLLCDGIGSRMNCFSSLEAYRDEGNCDGRGDAYRGSDLDFPFYARLPAVSHIFWQSSNHSCIYNPKQAREVVLTKVAEMPG